MQQVEAVVLADDCITKVRQENGTTSITCVVTPQSETIALLMANIAERRKILCVCGISFKDKYEKTLTSGKWRAAFVILFERLYVQLTLLDMSGRLHRRKAQALKEAHKMPTGWEKMTSMCADAVCSEDTPGEVVIALWIGGGVSILFSELNLGGTILTRRTYSLTEGVASLGLFPHQQISQNVSRIVIGTEEGNLIVLYLDGTTKTVGKTRTHNSDVVSIFVSSLTGRVSRKSGGQELDDLGFREGLSVLSLDSGGTVKSTNTATGLSTIVARSADLSLVGYPEVPLAMGVIGKYLIIGPRLGNGAKTKSQVLYTRLFTSTPSPMHTPRPNDTTPALLGIGAPVCVNTSCKMPVESDNSYLTTWKIHGSALSFAAYDGSAWILDEAQGLTSLDPTSLESICYIQTNLSDQVIAYDVLDISGSEAVGESAICPGFVAFGDGEQDRIAPVIPSYVGRTPGHSPIHVMGRVATVGGFVACQLIPAPLLFPLIVAPDSILVPFEYTTPDGTPGRGILDALYLSPGGVLRSSLGMVIDADLQDKKALPKAAVPCGQCVIALCGSWLVVFLLGLSGGRTLLVVETKADLLVANTPLRSSDNFLLVRSSPIRSVAVSLDALLGISVGDSINLTDSPTSTAGALTQLSHLAPDAPMFPPLTGCVATIGTLTRSTNHTPPTHAWLVVHSPEDPGGPDASVVRLSLPQFKPRHTRLPLLRQRLRTRLDTVSIVDVDGHILLLTTDGSLVLLDVGSGTETSETKHGLRPIVIETPRPVSALLPARYPVVVIQNRLWVVDVEKLALPGIPFVQASQPIDVSLLFNLPRPGTPTGSLRISVPGLETLETVPGASLFMPIGRCGQTTLLPRLPSTGRFRVLLDIRRAPLAHRYTRKARMGTVEIATGNVPTHIAPLKTSSTLAELLALHGLPPTKQNTQGFLQSLEVVAAQVAFNDRRLQTRGWASGSIAQLFDSFADERKRLATARHSLVSLRKLCSQLPIPTAILSNEVVSPTQSPKQSWVVETDAADDELVDMGRDEIRRLLGEVIQATPQTSDLHTMTSSILDLLEQAKDNENELVKFRVETLAEINEAKKRALFISEIGTNLLKINQELSSKFPVHKAGQAGPGRLQVRQQQQLENAGAQEAGNIQTLIEEVKETLSKTILPSNRDQAKRRQQISVNEVDKGTNKLLAVKEATDISILSSAYRLSNFSSDPEMMLEEGKKAFADIIDTVDKHENELKRLSEKLMFLMLRNLKLTPHSPSSPPIQSYSLPIQVGVNNITRSLDQNSESTTVTYKYDTTKQQKSNHSKTKSTSSTDKCGSIIQSDTIDLELINKDADKFPFSHSSKISASASPISTISLRGNNSLLLRVENSTTDSITIQRTVHEPMSSGLVQDELKVNWDGNDEKNKTISLVDSLVIPTSPDDELEHWSTE